MKIKIFAAPIKLPNLREEIDLIRTLCQFEGIQYTVDMSLSDDVKKYYKGSSPAIVFMDESNKEVIIYGFWNFVNWVIKNGYRRL